MPLAERELTVGELNAAWRGGFGGQLSGADKAAIAADEGVTNRTVQRWTTEGEQRRNPFPARLENLDREAWPEPYASRAEFTERLAAGGTNEETENASPAEFGEVFGSVPDANRWARDLENEALDPWLTEAWREDRIVKTDRGWEVRVVYDATVSPATSAAA